MIIIKQTNDLQLGIRKSNIEQQAIGFVPTMGALHEGHLSLIKQSKDKGNFTVCSIFVNPTQFNDSSDFEQYPRTLVSDILLLEANGCDLLFLPSVEEIYPEGTHLPEPYALGFIETILEGTFRPGHFQGVCQVVERLLRVVQPQELLLGQKDLQQILVLRKMIEQKNITVKITPAQTLREPEGLAMSSRNKRLTPEQKKQALIIHECLLFCKEHLGSIPLKELAAVSKERILSAGFEKIDYFSFHQAETLAPIDQWNGQEKIVAVFAGFIGGVRLIDNMFLNN